MNVTVTPDQEALILQSVANGQFGSPVEVVDEALRRLYPTAPHLSSDESQLFLIINRGLSEAESTRFDALIQLQREEQLTSEENRALDNVALSCQGCNGHKATKITGIDPATGQSTPLYHPRQHRWRDHFAWSADFKLMIGLSPTGRATVETLYLNREGIVNLREVLHGVGRHPPTEPS